MSERMHPQDLRAIVAALQLQAPEASIRTAVRLTDELLAELERSAMPEGADDIRARFDRFLGRMEEIFPEAGDRTELLAHAAAAKDRARAFQVALQEANESRMKMIRLVDDIRSCFPEGFHPELTLAGRICALAGSSRAEGARDERERIFHLLNGTGLLHVATEFTDQPGSKRLYGKALRDALEVKP